MCNTREITRNNWLYYYNQDFSLQSQSNFKFHVYLPIPYFDSHQERIYQVIQKAVDDGIILGFKRLNLGKSSTLMEYQGGVNVTISENKNVRIFNNPFTIYLHENSNYEHITIL